MNLAVRGVSARAFFALMGMVGVAVATNPAWAAEAVLEGGRAQSPEVSVVPIKSGLATVTPFQVSGSSGGLVWKTSADFTTYSSGDVEVAARSDATTAAVARVAVEALGVRYRLEPPTGARFNGGKVLLYATLVGGAIQGSGTLEAKMKAEVLRPIFSGSQPSGTGQTPVLTARPGDEEVELRAVLDLPSELDSTRTLDIDVGLSLKATADVSPVGGTLATAAASAKTSLVAFSVLDAEGKSVPGFTLRDGNRKIAERVAPSLPQAVAVEYFNAAFQHFFITANDAEKAALDAGTVWARTGQSFNVYADAGSGRAPVCRFFGEFPPKSSHFYTANPEECAKLRSGAVWTFEGIAFYAPVPSDATCGAGTTPVYRAYNGGRGGAPNHRFTTSEAIQADMLRDGYSDEGVAFCAPV